MSTWHQSKAMGRNAGLTAAIYEPHNTDWKVVTDPPLKMCSVMIFSSQKQAEDYAEKFAHSIVIPPKERSNPWTQQN